MGFAKRFSEFLKGIYETCNGNFFNLAIIIAIVVFSIVELLFLYFASNNEQRTVRNIRIPGGENFFFVNVTSWDIQFWT